MSFDAREERDGRAALPQLASPLGWLSRDHRKAFARSWALAGPPLPEIDPVREPPPAGDVSLRIVSSEPATTSMLRMDQLVAAIARERLWLTDAYYSGISAYVQALRAAAKDGVDVRLLVPNATDIPILQPFSRAGCASGQPRRPRPAMARGSGSTSAVAAGAIRIGNAVGPVLTDRRVRSPVQARLTTLVGFALCALSVLVAIFPRALALPAAALGLWGGLALLWQGIQLRRRPRLAPAPEDQSSGRELERSNREAS